MPDRQPLASIGRQGEIPSQREAHRERESQQPHKQREAQQPRHSQQPFQAMKGFRPQQLDDNVIMVKGIQYVKLETVGRGGSSEVFKVFSFSVVPRSFA